MIRAQLILDGIGELATLAEGPVPRIGGAMGDLGRVSDAAVAVDDGRFVFVGRRRALARNVRLRSGGRRLDADGGAVLPGFVDPHTHLLFAGDRSGEAAQKSRGATYAQIAAEGGGLLATVRATRRASDWELLEGAADRLGRMHRWGTAVGEVKSGYALTHAGELRLLRLVPALARRLKIPLVATFLGAHAVPPEFDGRADDYIEELVRRTLPAVRREGLAAYCDVFCEPGYFSLEQASRLLRAAAQLGFGLKLHADEFVYSGGARLAAELNATSAEHLLQTGAEDHALLARTQVTAVLAPVTALASNTTRASPGRALVDAGVPVALATDLSPNSWVEGMPVVLAHGVYSAHLTPAEAVTASTVNAAHAIGLGESAGIIAVGRRADLNVFDVPSVEHVAYRVGTIPALVLRQGIVDFSR
jgi:imidazolonepropionase